ncbi:MAG: Cro/CI family transcriptional regulator [Methylocystis sp.]
MKSRTAFDDVIARVGSQYRLADLLGLKQSTVSYWAKTKIPAERAVEIETLTQGRVPRSLCRPDLWTPPEPPAPADGENGSAET